MIVSPFSRKTFYIIALSAGPSNPCSLASPAVIRCRGHADNGHCAAPGQVLSAQEANYRRWRGPHLAVPEGPVRVFTTYEWHFQQGVSQIPVTYADCQTGGGEAVTEGNGGWLTGFSVTAETSQVEEESNFSVVDCVFMLVVCELCWYASCYLAKNCSLLFRVQALCDGRCWCKFLRFKKVKEIVMLTNIFISKQHGHT